MYKRQYGRMTISGWLNAELSQTHPALMIAGGVMMTLGGILVRASTGAPYRVMLELGIGELVPPVWLMTLLWTISFFIIGCAAGVVFGFRQRGCNGEKYKGCMFFILLAVLEFCWYPTLFGSGLVFLSVLESIACLCFAVCTTVCFYRISKLAGMLLLLHDLWLVYMLLLNFAIFFQN